MFRILTPFLLVPMLCFGQQSQESLKPVALEIQNFKSSAISFEEAPLFKSINSLQKTALNVASFDVDDAVFFDFIGGSEFLGKSMSNSPISIELPDARRGASVVLDLIPVDLFSSDFISNVDVSEAAHYRGVVRGHDGSLVSLSLFANEVIGFVSMDGQTSTLGKVKDHTSVHVLYSEMSQDWGLELSCADTEAPMTYSADKVKHGASQRNPGDCIRLKYEIDESLTNDVGGLSQATNYGTGVFNAQQTLYANDGINVILSELKVWSNADPAPYTLDGYETLDSYQALTGSFNGDLAYLSFSDGFTGGEAASIGGICQSNPYNSKAIGGAQGFYNGLPTYSFDVFIISHEVGHLFGARHTHACVWNGNNTAIDGCADFTEGGCSIPSNSPFAGTIMSYCASANFNEGFHPQVAQAIQDYISSRNCTNPCGPPTCEDDIQNGDETGVDCGGPDCPDCPSCDDGVQNGFETGVDCGGNCDPCPCDNGANVTITINLDNYPEETSWTLTTGSNEIASGGTYGSSPDGSTISEVLCLPAACYNFNINDSYGDGICCGFGNGSYEVTSPAGVLASGGNFSSSENTNFCIEEIPNACIEDINEDGMVDIEDMLAINSMFNTSCSGCPEDLNNDGFVNIEDFLIFNSAFGSSCDELIGAEERASQWDIKKELSKFEARLHPELKRYFDELAPLVRIFPNPTRDLLNLSIESENVATLHLQILDIQGRIMSSQNVKVQEGPNRFKVATDDLSEGSYVLNINSDTTAETLRFQIVK